MRVSGNIPAIKTDVVDFTGGGDAMTAAIIFGLLNDLPVDECVRLGVSAAALTLHCRDTVCPDISLDGIYDQLRRHRSGICCSESLLLMKKQRLDALLFDGGW